MYIIARHSISEIPCKRLNIFRLVSSSTLTFIHFIRYLFGGVGFHPIFLSVAPSLPPAVPAALKTIDVEVPVWPWHVSQDQRWEDHSRDPSLDLSPRRIKVPHGTDFPWSDGIWMIDSLWENVGKYLGTSDYSIFTYKKLNGWFLRKNVGKHTSPMSYVDDNQIQTSKSMSNSNLQPWDDMVPMKSWLVQVPGSLVHSLW